jgi:hypothetical protein
MLDYNINNIDKVSWYSNKPPERYHTVTVDFKGVIYMEDAVAMESSHIF